MFVPYGQIYYKSTPLSNRYKATLKVICKNDF